MVAVTFAPAAVGGSTALARDESRPILAYYYAWWDPSNFSQTLFQPDQAYNSDDVSMIQRHVQEAQAAGIDGFVMSWYGNGDRTDTNLRHLLDIGQKTGFTATVHFETQHFWGAEDVAAQLQSFYATYADNPALVRYQGRPVIFFWQAGTYDNATWNAIRAQVDPQRKAVWIADGDQFGILSGDAWDGISPYSIAWSGNPATQLPGWGAKAAAVAADKLFIPPVSPGCDDSAARAATCARDRANGSYYQATWDGALASNPPWAIMVSTFNEWMEATEIEPSVQYGDEYLQITRRNADTYRAAMRGPNG
jgi:Glycosyl hydrolase family 99